ncbi:MAG TPA: PfkB family carbohydrate kinase, partial [Sumerlaeia bacterium]|nr:PfkB family carbohydrate kinase [Sumerlaeia bacterium]
MTLNPCIDLNLEVADLPLGGDDMAREARPLRALAQRKRPGGKGVNVSAVLHILGVKSTAVVLLGGPGGEEFQRLAGETGSLSLRVVPAPGNTRTNIVITSRRDGRHLKVNQPGAQVGPEEIDRVRETIDSLVGPGDALVLAGSLPPGAPTGTYADLIERFRARGCWVALDSDGEAFREGLQARPHVLKPNREELGRVTRFALHPESAILETARRVVGDAPDTVCLVTDGPRPAYLVTAAHRLRATPPPAH